MTKEELQQIREMFREEIAPMKKDIEELKDSVEEIRGATNYMVEWIDRVEKKVDATA